MYAPASYHLVSLQTNIWDLWVVLCYTEVLMSTIGTAGHIDHGKSTLVKALTGIDPDRLAEEKERGMTIDLGFAWLKLPGGREISIIDVPGHEGFIKNMLAGVGGIDAALLVIAADEGVMPQTREHLAILDLLRVERGVVALTKAELVDEEWLELVRGEVAAYLRPTTLALAPIVAVSAYTGQGLPELLAELEAMLAEAEGRQNISRPRLPIDRVFTMTGFGTVVTGTLLDGPFKAGQEVEILPQRLRTRIRNLQMHKQSMPMVQPGNRVAMNLANIARADLARGDVVTLPGQLETSMLIDVHLRLLADAPRPLAHNTQVDFFSGSQEAPARVRLLEGDELAPGQSSWAQLRLSRPAVVARRDRFIVRLPSPSMTIGGGEVVEAHPRFHRRFSQVVFDQLATKAQGTPEELALAVLLAGRSDQRKAATGPNHAEARRPGSDQRLLDEKEKRGGRAAQRFPGYELADIRAQSNLAEDVALAALQTLSQEGRARLVGAYWFAQSTWEELATETQRLLADYHRRYPLRGGLSKEEWRSSLRLPPKLATDIFASFLAESVLAEASSGGGAICLPNFAPSFTQAEQQHIMKLLEAFRQNPFMPPDRAEAEALVGSEALAALIEQGQLVKVGESVLYLQEAYQRAIAQLLTFLRTHGTMTIAEARDTLGATRKYIVPLLEHMDALKLTRRIGDERVIGPASFIQK